MKNLFIIAFIFISTIGNCQWNPEKHGSMIPPAVIQPLQTTQPLYAIQKEPVKNILFVNKIEPLEYLVLPYLNQQGFINYQYIPQINGIITNPMLINWTNNCNTERMIISLENLRNQGYFNSEDGR